MTTRMTMTTEETTAQEVADIAAQAADVAESDARYASQHRRACESSFHAAHFNPADCE